MKRIISLICVFALTLSMSVMPISAQTTTTKTKSVYFTVEKLTIGQGLLVEPVKVDMEAGDTVAHIFGKVMAAKEMQYEAGDFDNFYLTNIKNADTGKINIPEEISKMPQYDYDFGGGYSGTYYAPSNDKNDGNKFLPDLGTGAYNGMSGWMFMLNNKGLSTGANAVSVNDGDVIRLHFSVFRWGDDIGIGYSEENMKLANKDSLIKAMADARESKEFMSVAAAKKAYDNGLKVLEKYNASEQEVKAAVEEIEKYQTQPDVTVEKAKIKSIKNVKTRKAKITVKKIKDATGYTFKYSKYKSLKKAKKKTTKATSIKTKKFKKKQTCYARVRAYKTVNKVKYYGKWSARKSVKIRK